MTTAYTSLLGLALPVTGELSGTWGDTVNTAITSLLDTAIAGTTSITVDADTTLSTTTGASNEARQAILLWNPASGTTTRYITAPAQSKLYTVINASGGTQSIVIRGVGPTTGVTIAKGESAMVAWNGSDFVKVSSSGGAITFTDLTVTGNTILGDAAADTLTVNATSTFASPVNFTGQVKLPSTGRSAAAALTPTNPAFLYGVASTYTDTTSSGTLAPVASFYGFARPTLSTSNVTTYTSAATMYIADAPAAGGSATITTGYSLYVASGLAYFGGSFNAVGSPLISLGSTTSAFSVRGAASGSANLILQDNAGTGVAWWLSGKTSGILSIGGNGSSEPALGAINIGSSGNVSVGATSGSGLFQVGTPGSSTGSLRAFSSYVSVDANYQSASVYGTAALPALIFGGDDNTGIWHPASDVIAFSNAGGETARFDASKNFAIGTTSTNGKLTVYNGVVGGTATTLSPTASLWMQYAGAVGDNRGAGPSFVLSQGLTPDVLIKSAAIGAPAEDSGGLSRTVGMSFWTSAFDASRAEVGRFTGNGGNFLVGKTADYGVNEANTVQAKGAIVWAADNTASADNRNWLASVNGSSNGSWDLINSSANNNWPNSAYILSVTRSGQATLGYGDMIIGGPVAATSRMFRAYEVGAAGNNAGLSCGAAGSKGSIWGASGAAGLFIAAGSGHGLNFGYAAGDSSLYANFNYLGVWNTTGLGIGTSSPQVRLTLRTTHQAPTGTTFTGALLIHDEPNGVVPHLGAGVAYDGGGNYSWIQSNSSGGTYPLVLNGAGGNVGVGLKIPARALDVAGILRLTSNPADTNYIAEIYSNYNSAHPFQLDVKNNGTTFEMWGMYANSGGGGERISSPSLDVAIGTTDTTGSLSNDKGVVAGRFRSFVGSVVQSGGGGWYDAFTIVNTGMYIVHAYIGGYNAGPSDWSNGWFISYTGGNNAYVGTSVFGATGNIQCQRKTGTATTFQLYLGGGVGIGYTYVLQRIG